MKKEIISRLLSGVITTGFWLAVRPDHTPSMWLTAMAAVVGYEIVAYGVREAWPEKRYHGYRINATRQDMVRVANTRVGEQSGQELLHRPVEKEVRR